jgi:hypothetical protein
MRLIAFRPEYQITVEPNRNRIFYKHYPELAQAAELPDYVSDWRQALAEMRPGFTILSDMTALDSVSALLAALIAEAQQLAIEYGVGLVAAVHAPDSATHRAALAGELDSALPVRSFIDLWEADKFLDGTREGPPEGEEASD